MLRFGRTLEPDAVFRAWTSHDLVQMRAVLGAPTNGVDRHYLLSTMVEQLHKRRHDPPVRQELFEVGRLHIAELPALVQDLHRDRVCARELTQRREEERAIRTCEAVRPLPPFDDRLWYYEVPTFVLLVRARCEIEQYDAAREVWHEAHRIGYLEADRLARELEGVERRRRKNDRAAARL